MSTIHEADPSTQTNFQANSQETSAATAQPAVQPDYAAQTAENPANSAHQTQLLGHGILVNQPEAVAENPTVTAETTQKAGFITKRKKLLAAGVAVTGLAAWGATELFGNHTHTPADRTMGYATGSTETASAETTVSAPPAPKAGELIIMTKQHPRYWDTNSSTNSYFNTTSDNVVTKQAADGSKADYNAQPAPADYESPIVFTGPVTEDNKNIVAQSVLDDLANKRAYAIIAGKAGYAAGHVPDYVPNTFMTTTPGVSIDDAAKNFIDEAQPDDNLKILGLVGENFSARLWMKYDVPTDANSVTIQQGDNGDEQLVIQNVSGEFDISYEDTKSGSFDQITEPARPVTGTDASGTVTNKYTLVLDKNSKGEWKQAIS
jgi:hypothetical protein